MAYVTEKRPGHFTVQLNRPELELYLHYAAHLNTQTFILFQEFVNRHLKKLDQNCQPGGTLIGGPH